jgi:hypothetical protein
LRPATARAENERVPFEIRVDCPRCRVEGARIETWVAAEPSERLGVPGVAECRLCGRREVGRPAEGSARAEGEGCPGCGASLDDASLAAHRCPFCGASATSVEVSSGRLPASADELRSVLGAWALAEGLTSADELLQGYFVATTAAEILAALGRGEAVETTFDVVDFLFSSGHGQSAGEAAPSSPASRDAKPAPPPPSSRRVPVAASLFDPAPLPAPAPSQAPASVRAPASTRPVGGPRDELLALASVAASDGEASAADLAVLAQAAAARGLPPLSLDEIRVRRPAEIDAPATLVARERLLEEMFQMAWSDDELDESEIRVVREFARAWGVDPQRVTEWTAIATSRGSSRVARWIDRVGYFLFPGW